MVEGNVPSHRWGWDRPVHPGISAALWRHMDDYVKVLAEIGQHKAALHAIQGTTDSPTLPYWRNGYFSGLDGAALVGLLLSRKPARYVEVGSGNSTKFARYAARYGQLATHITSIDPEPRAEIDELCDVVIRAQLQTWDQSICDELMPGDIFFFDGSHRLETNSDSTVFFLEILPRLKPGVLVHVHDIYWPFDYLYRNKPNKWNDQYLLGALLLFSQVKLVLPNYFACSHPPLREIVQELFRAEDPARSIPMHYADNPLLTGVSFWFETTKP